MDRGSGSLSFVLKTTVYAVAVIIGSTVLIADPTADVRFLPVAVGLTVLVHAVHRGDLAPIEYSILGLYGTVLGIVVVTVVATTSGVAVPNVVTADTTVSVLLSSVILVVYIGRTVWPSSTTGFSQ